MDKIDSVLSEIEKEAAGGRRFLPIVGPDKGKFDYLLARATGARRILDLGTLVGYSALLFSKAVGPKGRVVTIELDPEMAREASRNFKKAGVANIRLIRGDAREELKRLISEKHRFDLILLDIYKDAYIEVFDDCIRLLRTGGVVLSDNALWNTKELKEFRKFLQNHEKAESVLVPIGDGIAMSVKKY
jgi:predicted O-methyltransferase YrrM